MTYRSISRLVLGVALLSLAALSGYTPHEVRADSLNEGVSIQHGWVRAVPPTSRMSAAYMQLQNHATEEDHLVSATSDVAKVVELHNVRKHSGMMEMYQVKSIGISGGSTTELKPGSYHIMLIDLVKPLKVGDQISLTLNFMNGGAQTITLPVKEGGMMRMPQGGNH
ncbi:copper chaperone PCu(A)C [Ectothiorhodospiraceae bacterium BW-2]|nr:copper chaperone PCu(A)C [Ectothiorhodospiraceae bacterium BW-2]